MEDIQYNNKGYYLIGAGGLSRELESWTTKSEFSKNNELLGFIDDNSDVLEKYPSDYKILDSFFNGEIWKGNNVLIGACSMVNCSIPDSAVVIGVPAIIISQNGSKGYI